MTLPAGNEAEYVGALSGERVKNCNGQITVNVRGNSGEIWLPARLAEEAPHPEKTGAESADPGPEQTETRAEDKTEPEKAAAEKPSEAEEEQTVAEEPSAAEGEKAVAAELSAAEEEKAAPENPPRQPVKKPYEEMSIEELQEAILERMRRNGPVTDRMRQDVIENVYHNSLLNWIRSFS